MGLLDIMEESFIWNATQEYSISTTSKIKDS